MKEILTTLFNFFSDNQLPLEKDLQEPLEENIVKEKLLATTGIIPDELVELYTWKNGTTQFGWPTNFFSGHYFQNLDSSMEDYNAFQKLEADSFGLNFKPHFPIFLTGAGEYYFYCFEGDLQGKITYESAGEFLGEIVVAFNSFTDMFSSILEGYKSGVYYFENETRQKTDYRKESELMQKMNPNCKRWADEDDEQREAIMLEW